MFLGSGELCSLDLFLLWEAMETAKDRKGTWPVPLRFWFLPKKKRGYKEMSNISLTPP